MSTPSSHYTKYLLVHAVDLVETFFAIRAARGEEPQAPSYHSAKMALLATLGDLMELAVEGVGAPTPPPKHYAHQKTRLGYFL
jgi:hypothetical protein